MNLALTNIDSWMRGKEDLRAHWVVSALVYVAFSALVFAVHGSQPLLGSDHLSYFQMADSILAACPRADYWREITSVRTYGVLLAYMYAWTGSHVLSMKVILLVFSVLYLLSAELFFSLFARSRRQAMLFAILSAFAVSFGIASWGVTDSTALLPRTLVAPIMMFSLWWWFRYDGRPFKYLAFFPLVLGSLLHLSTFYLIGVLVLVEICDVLFLTRRFDARLPAFAGGLLLALFTLFLLESAGVSSRLIGIQIPSLLRSAGVEVENLDSPQGACEAKPPTPKAARDIASPVAMPVLMLAEAPAAPTQPAPTARPERRSVPEPSGNDPRSVSAKEAWAVELALRPWRNMPMPWVNVLNALSSCAIVLLLAVAGMVAAKRGGFNRVDKLMLAMFVMVPVFAFGPQTSLWILRSFTSVYPATIEEVRAISLVMVPALYFCMRLVDRILERGGTRARWKAAAVCVGIIALPLFMKNMPFWAREGILSAMAALHVIDPANPSSVVNARAALGLSAQAAPLYYSTRNVRAWLQANAPGGARILTDRDDMILLRDKILLGPRQVDATSYVSTTDRIALFLSISRAMAARDTTRIVALGTEYDADYAVVPWRVANAVFADDEFSVIALRQENRT